MHIGGIDYDFTTEDLLAIYQFMDNRYTREDITSSLEEMGVSLTNEQIAKCIDIVDNVLANHDSYWDIYWSVIEYAIEEVTSC